MIITIGLKKKVHEMEREHCQIEHRKSKSCPTARQIKFDSVRHLPTPDLSGVLGPRKSLWNPRLYGWWKIKNPRFLTILGRMCLRH